MELETFITGVVSLITGGGLSGILFYREKKKTKKLENSALLAEQWEKIVGQLKGENGELKEDVKNRDDKIDRLYKENGTLRDANNNLSTENAVFKVYYCDDLPCSKRNPPIGKK